MSINGTGHPKPSSAVNYSAGRVPEAPLPGPPALERSVRYYGGSEPHHRAPPGFATPLPGREFRTDDQLAVFGFILKAEESDASSVFLGVLKDIGAEVDRETGLVTPPEKDFRPDTETLKMRFTRHLKNSDDLNEVVTHLRKCLCLSHLVEQMAQSTDLGTWLDRSKLSEENQAALEKNSAY